MPTSANDAGPKELQALADAMLPFILYVKDIVELANRKYLGITEPDTALQVSVAIALAMSILSAVVASAFMSCCCSESAGSGKKKPAGSDDAADEKKKRAKRSAQAALAKKHPGKQRECRFCKIEVPLPEMDDAHLSGKRHKRAAEAAGYMPGEQIFHWVAKTPAEVKAAAAAEKEAQAATAALVMKQAEAAAKAAAHGLGGGKGAGASAADAAEGWETQKTRKGKSGAGSSGPGGSSSNSGGSDVPKPAKVDTAYCLPLTVCPQLTPPQRHTL